MQLVGKLIIKSKDKIIKFLSEESTGRISSIDKEGFYEYLTFQNFFTMKGLFPLKNIFTPGFKKLSSRFQKKRISTFCRNEEF